jgi:hypothetical protein
MKHSFTARELILICIAAVMALGIFYYEAVYKAFTQSAAKYDTAQLEDELTLAQMQAAQEAQMKQAIADASVSKATAEVAVYNNLANEVNALGTILNGNAENVAINWSAPTLTDTTVRRQASISFKTGSYEAARALIQSISDMKYRNIISSVTVTNATSTSDPSTTVSLTLTFFETSNGASSTEGLVDTTSSES